MKACCFIIVCLSGAISHGVFASTDDLWKPKEQSTVDSDQTVPAAAESLKSDDDQSIEVNLHQSSETLAPSAEETNQPTAGESNPSTIVADQMTESKTEENFNYFDRFIEWLNQMLNARPDQSPTIELKLEAEELAYYIDRIIEWLNRVLSKGLEQAQDLPSWRERYTLGPGDVVNIRFYGQSDLDRSGLRIAPDGTLSYLQVNSLNVNEMTIDEMREAFEAALLNYYRNPRLIITPWELKSKRYVILGKVIDKGVFTLDRPITLLEAIARSRGIETGLFEQSTVEIADMDRSFIMRSGERLDVDFSKLYFEGDLSQNVYLEPQDYIFLASNLSNEYYVLGAVAQPGAQGFSNRASIISAVTRREGFTEGSWKRRVLVIRGSLSDPQVFVVDVNAILKGLSPDFLLEPGDIVYVNNRPWYKAEQIIDTAIENFIKSATSTWVIENVPDAIENPWFKRTGWREAPGDE